MASKAKRKKAKELHQRAKRRAKVKRVLSKYRGHLSWADLSSEQFEALIVELSGLNVKYLQQLLSDLNENIGFGDPNKNLRHRVEMLLLERTVLK